MALNSQNIDYTKNPDSLHLALNSQNIDYTKNPDLFLNIYQNEFDHHIPRKKYINLEIINLLRLKRCVSNHGKNTR